MQNNYVIKPIFDQKADPCLWDVFVDIETSARAQHGHMFMYGSYSSIIDNYYQAYKDFDNNVVFCAYINDALVGFIAGYQLESGDFYLDSLFVKPEFQGRGIGKTLLSEFEHAVNLFSTNIHGMSYSWANSFYKHQAYNIRTNAQDTKMFYKELKKTVSGIYPVFKCDVSGFRVKQTSNADILLLNKLKHRPIAVYVNNHQEIDSIGFVEIGGKEQFYFNNNLLPDVRELRKQQIKNYLSNAK